MVLSEGLACCYRGTFDLIARLFNQRANSPSSSRDGESRLMLGSTPCMQPFLEREGTLRVAFAAGAP